MCQQEEPKVIVSIEDSDANTQGHELFVQRLSIYGLRQQIKDDHVVGAVRRAWTC